MTTGRTFWIAVRVLVVCLVVYTCIFSSAIHDVKKNGLEQTNTSRIHEYGAAPHDLPDGTKTVPTCQSWSGEGV